MKGGGIRLVNSKVDERNDERKKFAMYMEMKLVSLYLYCPMDTDKIVLSMAVLTTYIRCVPTELSHADMKQRFSSLIASAVSALMTTNTHIHMCVCM
jgi:hypothetical protein